MLFFNGGRESLDTFDHFLDSVRERCWICNISNDHLILVQKEPLGGWIDANWKLVVDGSLVKDQGLFVVDDMHGVALVAREPQQNSGKAAYVRKFVALG